MEEYHAIMSGSWIHLKAFVLRALCLSSLLGFTACGPSYTSVPPAYDPGYVPGWQFQVVRDGEQGGARVENLTARQEGRDAVLSYDLAGGKSGGIEEVILEISLDGGNTWKVPKGLWGDVGKGVPAGSGKRIQWAATDDFPEGLSREILFRVLTLNEKNRPVTGAKESITFTGKGVSFKMIRVHEGEFMMGSELSAAEVAKRFGGEEEWFTDENPQHRVRITKDYWMGETEVTQGLWKAVMGANPSRFSSCGDDCPVEQVSWNDCQEFIRKLNGMVSGGSFRLPTEAEWEYAARAGTTSPYAGDLDSMAWYANNSGDRFIDAVALYNEDKNVESYLKKILANGCRTHPVAKKRSNGWGLYDMHGNVWEWCSDWYGNYPSGSVTDPAGFSSGSNRVLRGGGWDGIARYCRSADRIGYDPGNRYDGNGFRLARP